MAASEVFEDDDDVSVQLCALLAALESGTLMADTAAERRLHRRLEGAAIALREVEKKLRR